MAPQDKSQFKKFDNILARISDAIDSGKGDSIEIYDEIKNQLREELNNVYEEWKNSEFNPNFRFKLDDGYEVETTLLHIAIQCRKSAACAPLVQCLLDQGADPNVQDSPYSSFTLTCVLMPFLNHPCPIFECVPNRDSSKKNSSFPGYMTIVSLRFFFKLLLFTFILSVMHWSWCDI